MKKIYSYVYLGGGTFLSIVLGIYSIRNGSYRKMDAYMAYAIGREQDYYNEEMAVRLAAVLGPDERKLRGTFEESVEVVFNYPTNEWLVIYWLSDPIWDRLMIGVRRDTGSIENYGYEVVN